MYISIQQWLSNCNLVSFPDWLLCAGESLGMRLIMYKPYNSHTVANKTNKSFLLNCQSNSYNQGSKCTNKIKRNIDHYCGLLSWYCWDSGSDNCDRDSDGGGGGPHFTLFSISLLATNDLYFPGSRNSFNVVLCVRDSISFFVSSKPTEWSLKFSFFNDLFLSSISANPVAPLTPIGLLSRINIWSVSFVHRGLANWHALSESMSHRARLR